MLRELSIQHLATVEELNLSFSAGMTTLTGETGAGKSILIDALSLTLGARADSSFIRSGKQTCSVSTLFEIKNHPEIQTWLKEQDLFSGEDCILRRTVSIEGPSRAYINGQLVTVQQLKELGEKLINIHGQHQNQALLRTDHQREILDYYAEHPTLCNEVAHAYQTIEKLKIQEEELKKLEGQQAMLDLLLYQIQELEELNLQNDELQNLEIEHRKLTHAKEWLMLTDHVLNVLSETYSHHETQEGKIQSSVITSLHGVLQSLTPLKAQFSEINNVYELVNNGVVQLEEAAGEMQSFKNTFSLDPERQVWIDERLSRIYALARKHKIAPPAILSHYQELKERSAKLQTIQEHLASIGLEIKKAEDIYKEKAEKLSKSRKKAAGLLSNRITTSLKELEMPHGQFEIHIHDKKLNNFNQHGIDDIEFKVTTNPGLPLQPLRKIASGGEISRISLAIQVITAQKMTIPSLIFDEVDVGISGKTAQIVGELLRKLGEHAQVFCVTHLPQVAALGHQHYKVEKQQTDLCTHTRIIPLERAEKIKEIARMLGGITITSHTLAHAESLVPGT